MEERLSVRAGSRAIVDSADSSGVPESPDRRGGVREHHRGERARHLQDQDIVQRSASEQAQ